MSHEKTFIEEFHEQAMVSAFMAARKLPPTDWEEGHAVYLAGKIFGTSTRDDIFGTSTRDDKLKRGSEILQCLCLLRIVAALIAWTERRTGLAEALGIAEGYAIVILDQYGAGEHPFNLPPDHHRLAQDALKLVMEISEMTRLLKDRVGGTWELTARQGARLMRIVDFMERRWYMADLVRGQKQMAAVRKAHITAHGTAEERQQRHSAYLAEWKKLRKEHPDWCTRAIDDEVAQCHGVSYKTVQRARSLQKNS